VGGVTLNNTAISTAGAITTGSTTSNNVGGVTLSSGLVYAKSINTLQGDFSNWTQTYAGPDSFNGIASNSDGTILTAFKTTGEIYGSSDSGTTWTPRTVGLPTGAQWQSIACSYNGAKVVVCSGRNNTAGGSFVYTSSDYGVSWVLRTSGLPSSSGIVDYRSVASSSDGTKLLVTAYWNRYIFRSTDSGATWTNIAINFIYWNAVACSADGQTIYAAANEDYIYKATISTGGSASWVQCNNTGVPAGTYWEGLWCSQDGVNVIANDYLQNYITTNGGITSPWTITTYGGLGPISTASYAANGLDVVMCLRNGYIYTSTDSGLTITPQNMNGLPTPSSSILYLVLYALDRSKILARSGTSIYTTTKSVSVVGGIDIFNGIMLTRPFGAPISIGSGGGTSSTNAISIGNTGKIAQMPYAIGIGYSSGYSNQTDNAIAIGTNAGCNAQAQSAIALGSSSGKTNQGSNAIAIGVQAGQTDQSAQSIAIGTNAGQTTQKSGAIAIGGGAGATSQGTNSIAIGQQAGESSLAAYSIAIGALATRSNDPGATIVINARSTEIIPAQASSCYISPIRKVISASLPTGLLPMAYNPITGELVCYGPS
jgi:hypothetical protein